MAIQWHICDHSGLSRLGASGSVKASVYSLCLVWVAEDVRDKNSMAGADCTLAGTTVFPSSAVAFSQKMDSATVGEKVSSTVGMISAFLSLVVSALPKCGADRSTDGLTYSYIKSVFLDASFCNSCCSAANTLNA